MDFENKIKILRKQLDNINSENSDILDITNQSIIICRNTLSDFKKLLSKSGFKNISEEMKFFKEVKQFPLSNLIFHFEIKSFEIKLPKGNLEAQKRFTLKKINKINRFNLHNLDFLQYIKLGETYLDDRYFTRKHFNNCNITHSKYYFQDPEFSTSHDLLLAKVKAYNKLIKYLEIRLANLGKPMNKIKNLNFKPLNWTGSKTDMTELGYALKFHGSINNGNVNVNEIIHLLEMAFNFKSGDPYKNYSEIRIRKKSRTKFLDELAIGLQSKMSNDDR